MRSKKPANVALEDYENEEHNFNRFNYIQRQKVKIQEWISNIPSLKIPIGFNLEMEPVTYFKDG